MILQPYLFFQGRADEAIEHYRQALGAEVTMLTRFAESPDPPPPGMLPPGSGKKVMHAEVRIGEATVMISDGECRGAASFDGFSLALSLPDAEAVDRAFAALADGGEVTMPLAKTFWSPRFGMLKDRFGVGWMIGVLGDDTAADEA